MMQSIAPNIKNPNGTFNKIFASYPDIDFKQDGRGIRSMQNIGLFDQNQYNTQSKNTQTKYTNMWTDLYNSYRMLKYIDIDFSEPEGKLKNPMASEIADYINMVDSI